MNRSAIAPNPFTLLHCGTKSRARRGRLELPHGTVETPAFMPVGTAATIKSVLPRDVEATGAEMVLANTYHLAIQPGEERIEKLGGLHRFMGWRRPILTDSGGFQVFSLPGREIDEEGVRFRYELSGDRVLLTPERSMAIQQALGADIAMAFDECIPYPASHDYAARSVDRTLRWARRCLDAHVREDQCLFGIVQGGVYEDLRARCARETAELPFHGCAIGGVSVGEGLDNLKRVVDFTERHMPAERVRYLMGVGLPVDVLESIARGMDIFDCVIPTRYGRGGTLFTTRGRIRIDLQRYRRDGYPIDRSCECHACTNFSRAYVHHLFQARELLGPTLASIHNLHFYQSMMANARRAIEQDRFDAWKDEFLEAMGVDGAASVEVARPPGAWPGSNEDRFEGRTTERGGKKPQRPTQPRKKGRPTDSGRRERGPGSR